MRFVFVATLLVVLVNVAVGAEDSPAVGVDLSLANPTPSADTETKIDDDYVIPDPDAARFNVRILPPYSPERGTSAVSLLLRYLLTPLTKGTTTKGTPFGSGENSLAVGPEVSPLTRRVLEDVIASSVPIAKGMFFPDPSSPNEKDYAELLEENNGDVQAAYVQYRSNDGIDAASLVEPDATSAEIDGWQPMALPNGTQYMCKIPPIAYFYNGGKGQFKGDDDILLDIATMAESSLETLGEPADSGDVGKLGSTPLSIRARLEAALAKIPDSQQRKSVVKELQMVRTSAQLLAMASRDAIEEAMNAADEADKPVHKRKASRKNGGKGEAQVGEPSEEAVAAAIKQLTKGEKIPDAIRQVFERRLGGGSKVSKSAVNPPQLRVVPHTGSSPLPHNCFQQNAGWWTYEYCFGKHVAEFHQERGQGEVGMGKVNVLGLGPEHQLEYGAAFDEIYYMTDSFRGAYFSAVYYNGTVCDKTLQQRVVDVRMYCVNPVVGRSPVDLKLTPNALQPENKYTSLHISEPETCKYVIWVGSPHFCFDAIWRAQTGPSVQINCRRVDGS